MFLQNGVGLSAGERRREEASHQEAAQRVHVVYEGGAAQGGGSVQSEGERHHQPDTGTEGECGRFTSHEEKR